MSKPGRVVIIDDCQLTLAIARDILTEGGFEVVAVTSGLEANQHIFGPIPPQLLLIDVELPMLNGDQKVRLLKSRERSRQIPVILMSGKTADELAALANAAGADAWVCKPLRADRLLPLAHQLTGTIEAAVS